MAGIATNTTIQVTPDNHCRLFRESYVTYKQHMQLYTCSFRAFCNTLHLLTQKKTHLFKNVLLLQRGAEIESRWGRIFHIRPD